MDYTKVFYWLTVADNARTLFGWGVGIFTAIAVIATIVNIWCRGGSMNSDNSSTEQEDYAKSAAVARKWMMWSYPFMFLWWVLLIFTPSKRDALLIVAGGQTLNYLANDSVAKKLPTKALLFVEAELDNMAADAGVKLNVSNQKTKILEEAKAMSSEKLLEKMKTDTTYAKVIKDLLKE